MDLINQLRKEVAEFRDEVKRLTGSLDIARDSAVDWRSQFKTLEEQHRQVQDMLHEAKKNIATLTEKLRFASLSNTELRDQLRAHEYLLGSTQEALDERNAENEKLRSACASVTGLLADEMIERAGYADRVLLIAGVLVKEEDRAAAVKLSEEIRGLASRGEQ